MPVKKRKVRPLERPNKTDFAAVTRRIGKSHFEDDFPGRAGLVLDFLCDPDTGGRARGRGQGGRGAAVVERRAVVSNVLLSLCVIATTRLLSAGRFSGDRRKSTRAVHFAGTKRGGWAPGGWKWRETVLDPSQGEIRGHTSACSRTRRLANDPRTRVKWFKFCAASCSITRYWHRLEVATGTKGWEGRTKRGKVELWKGRSDG